MDWEGIADKLTLFYSTIKRQVKQWNINIEMIKITDKLMKNGSGIKYILKK